MPAKATLSTPNACRTMPAASRPGRCRFCRQQATPSTTRPMPSTACRAMPAYSGRRLRRARSKLRSRSSCSCSRSWRARRASSACQAESRASSSMMVSMCRGVRSEFVAEALFQASDLGGDVAFADAEDLGDLALRPLVEVEQQQRAVQRRLAGDEGLQQAQLLLPLVVDDVAVG